MQTEAKLKSARNFPRAQTPDADRNPDARIERLTRLAADLLADLADLEVYQLMELSISENVIDFYAVLREFEVLLIKRALKRTSGSQVKAAQLLTMNLTTLNSKIKSFKIPTDGRLEE